MKGMTRSKRAFTLDAVKGVKNQLLLSKAFIYAAEALPGLWTSDTGVHQAAAFDVALVTFGDTGDRFIISSRMTAQDTFVWEARPA